MGNYHGVVYDQGADFLAVAGYPQGFGAKIVIEYNRGTRPYLDERRHEPLLLLTPEQAIELARHLTAGAEVVINAR